MSQGHSSGDSPRDWLFTYGILRDPATLRAILGYTPPGGEAAHVLGYERRTSADGYYYLVPAATSVRVPGILWQVTPADLRLLDLVEDVDPADPAGAAGEYRRVRGCAYTPSDVVPCWLDLGGTIAAP
jgi:hypothetical protein